MKPSCNKSNATSSLVPSEMIAKQYCTTKQEPYMNPPLNNGSNNKQWIDNNINDISHGHWGGGGFINFTGHI